jgi:hypothetical protein
VAQLLGHTRLNTLDALARDKSHRLPPGRSLEGAAPGLLPVPPACWQTSSLLLTPLLQVVAPKKAKLAEAEATYAEVMLGLKAKQAELAGLLAKLAAMEEELAGCTARKAKLEAEINLCRCVCWGGGCCCALGPYSCCCAPGPYSCCCAPGPYSCSLLATFLVTRTARIK